MYKVFTCFLCGCSLVRVTTRWWTLMVAPHLHPLCLGESVFPWGFFGAVLSGPFPALSFLKVCHLGAWWFRGIPVGFLSCPLSLGHILIVSCRIPFSCVWGGGREREYTITIIIMHSCNPNDRFDL